MCKVSVIMPTYNGSQFISASIESALNQTYRDLEIIVVDDGSTDNTVEVVKKFGSRVALLQQQNGGTASARNFGIAHATGSLIGLLDHDDLWLPNKLEVQVPVLMESDKVGMVHTGARWFQSETGAVTSEWTPPPSLDYHQLMSWCDVSCCTVMFKRAAFDRAGPFDAALLGTDDWDLWIRIAGLYEVKGIPLILSEVRLHGSNQGGNAEKTYRQCMRVATKSRPLHANCEECDRARKRAISRVKADYYNRMSAASAQAIQEKRFVEGALLRLRGISRHPASLLNGPRRIIKKVAARSA